MPVVVSHMPTSAGSSCSYRCACIRHTAKGARHDGPDVTDTAQRCAGPGPNLHRGTRASCRQRRLFPAPTRLRFQNQNQHTAAFPSTLNGRMRMAAHRGRATALVCQAEAAGPAVRAGNCSAPLTCPCRSPQPGCQSCAQMLRWSPQVRGPPSTHLPARDSELAAVRREHAPRR